MTIVMDAEEMLLDEIRGLRSDLRDEVKGLRESMKDLSEGLHGLNTTVFGELGIIKRMAKREELDKQILDKLEYIDKFITERKRDEKWARLIWGGVGGGTAVGGGYLLSYLHKCAAAIIAVMPK